ncbi:MAG: hypothetical protein M3O15_03350, partial [Acidobacteriota bacterium]|nr:hypothetical protein [Acidobacteriota bacterium]
PEQLGRLHGVALAGLQTDRRQEALRIAVSMGHDLRKIGAERQRLAEGQVPAQQAAATLESVRPLADRLSRTRARLPEVRNLHRDIAVLTEHLGAKVIQSLTLSVRAVRVISQAVSLARKLAKTLDHDHGRGR